MKYVVVELQGKKDQVANIVTAYSSVNQAEEKYHQVLSAAAVSSIPCHSCVMLNEEGMFIKSECFKHETESQE